jgi:cell fate regulator YaaT (PSP1 superfamily)
MSEQKTVVAVRLRYNPKSYWFDPVLSTYQTGDHVLVDTERGREIGLVVDGALQVTEKQLKDIKEPLKPVIRALTEVDYQRIDELDAKGREAMPIFRELIEKHELDMKPVSVDYLFTGDKAVFYFSNDDRVDFRDLVRDLASRFHIRVDMRQIGVRDEARILGGLAHCGEELCCTRLGGEFQPVSIRMAKEQDLPLNPTKISGACGRLMCCLRYEFEAYKDFKGRAPKKGAVIETPIGQAKVIDFDTPREVITLRLEDGKQLSVPLKDFECDAGADGKQHPCRISRETIDRCASSSILMALAALEQEVIKTETETRSEKHSRDHAADQGGRRLRRGKRKEEDSGTSENAAATKQGSRSKDNNRSKPARFAAGQQGAAGQGGTQQNADKAKGGSDEKKTKDKKRSEGIMPRRRGAKGSKPRPGQHSSGLRSAERESQGERSGQRSGQGERSERSANQSSGANQKARSGQGERNAKQRDRGNGDTRANAGDNNNRSEQPSRGLGGLRRRRRGTNKPNQ